LTSLLAQYYPIAFYSIMVALLTCSHSESGGKTPLSPKV
jgi:hypothetical protein